MIPTTLSLYGEGRYNPAFGNDKRTVLGVSFTIIIGFSTMVDLCIAPVMVEPTAKAPPVVKVSDTTSAFIIAVSISEEVEGTKNSKAECSVFNGSVVRKTLLVFQRGQGRVVTCEVGTVKVDVSK